MPRIFVALALPETTKDQLIDLNRPLPGARWMDEDKLHLTLRFVGETDHGQFNTIRDGLMGIKTESFELKPKGVGHFPPRGDPKSLWAGFEANEMLIRLQKKIDHVICQKGFIKDKRKFMPHVTLARLKATPAVNVAQFIIENSLFSAEPFWVSEFQLYSSEPSFEGSFYRLEETYSLLSKAA